MFIRVKNYLINLSEVDSIRPDGITSQSSVILFKNGATIIVDVETEELLDLVERALCHAT